MKIGVVGLGYVGSTTAAVLASLGNIVTGIDVDHEKVEKLSNFCMPFYEPGLEEVIRKASDKLKFTTRIDKLSEMEIVFVTVQTPNRNGKVDLGYVMQAANEISKVNKDCIIALKSTVIPGTARLVAERTGMEVISNPEFTKEGSAITDTVSPDRVVLGGHGNAMDVMRELWNFTNAPVIETTWENAELIKYSSNVFLATKISFINEISNLCEKIVGADIEIVARGMGLDRRIGKEFLKAGLGYGGSCLQKDTISFLEFAQQKRVNLRIAGAASIVNENRISHAIDLIKKETCGDLSGTALAILGLSFKNGTDDIRESQSIKLVKRLIPLSGKINLYDPVAHLDLKGTENFDDEEKCIEASDIIAIATEWPQFKNVQNLSRGKPVIDLRRVVDISSIPNLKSVGVGINKN